ncbi:hypothetical protein [Blastococcus sp. CT_GayMR16]|uniref:hypothetical protein n=1 Tax=Blastococcus sp. CT_GayMR16 TaxID=2559607 RepID=UPI0010743A81|nr:hypothetical protein [Blastococcus sp. CT_GayMR16]TFV87756.1 hypothetical protein E4P38_12305 [Blastococcus sp. CT_GayMR16]
MDIPAAAAGSATVPWFALGIVVGVLGVLLAGLTAALVLRRRVADHPAAAPAAAPEGLAVDDLPGFLETPPGSAGAAPHTGWAALTAPPVPAPPAPVPLPRARRDTVVVLASMAVTALLLVGAAAAVAAASRPDGRRGHSSSADATRDRDGAAARLTFGGLVLEPRAVGVTATYPVVEVSTDGEQARAHVEFPTFNCLTGEAPPDPVAAGCTRTQTEYAELASPELVVDREGDGLRVTGRFPTELRPNGSAPTPTGRVYELRITVAPADAGAGRGWRPADGVLELGSGRADTVDDVSVLRSDS